MDSQTHNEHAEWMRAREQETSRLIELVNVVFLQQRARPESVLMVARAFRNAAVQIISENNPAGDVNGAAVSLEKHVDENLSIKIRHVTMPVADA